MAIDWTKPIQTASGTAARLIGEAKHYEGTKHVVAIDYDDYELIGVCGDDGECRNEPAAGVRIVNAPKKMRGYLNVYPSGNREVGFCVTGPYPTTDAADREASPGRFGVAFIEITDDEAEQ